MRYIKITALIGVVLLIVSGCGQRGPLYAPQEKPETTPVPATEIVTPATNTLPAFKGA
ncbi:MAG: putative small lipoprotein YifL [Alphaproteobacteria bacterium]|jgi:predicted small lipoprotein YifL